MGLTFYEIDPSGDTLLILQNANAPFAVLPSSGAQEEEKASGSTPDDKTTDADSKPKDEGSTPKDPDSKPTVQMRLSSKHLTLASKYFQKLTANNWKESKEATPEFTYSYVINASDWDEKALLLLMNIIHGRTSKVPRYIDLELLAKMAVLVDYYQCHEVVAFFSQTWLSSIFIVIPKKGERDFMLRLVVCLVFSETFNFQLLTKTIIWGSTGPIDSLGLPIKQDIIDALNDSREYAIEMVVAEFLKLRQRLCEDQSCSFECSSIHLGALLKAMSKMGLMDPIPTSPYPGHSLLALEQAIRDIKEPAWKTNCPESSAPTKESTKTSTKPAPGQSSNTSDGAPSTNTKSPPAQAATAPRFGFSSTPSGGLFGNATSAPAGGSGTNTSSGGLFGGGSTASTGGSGTNTSSGGLFGGGSTTSTRGLFGNATSTPTGGSGTNTSSGGLFGGGSTASTGGSGTNTSSGGLFGGGSTASTRGLFGNATSAPTGGSGTNTSSGSVFGTAVSAGGLFGKPTPSGGLFGKAASSDAEDKTKVPPPRCSLAAKTGPIVEKLLKTFNGLDLYFYVEKE